MARFLIATITCVIFLLVGFCLRPTDTSGTIHELAETGQTRSITFRSNVVDTSHVDYSPTIPNE